MTYPSKPLVACLLVLGGLGGLAIWLAPVSPLVLRKTFPLESIRQETLEPWEVHRYIASLRKGDFLRAAVDQDTVKKKEIDISIRVLNPRGVTLYEIDSPKGPVGSEEVYLVADRDGVFTLEVVGSGKSGIYRLRLLFVRHGSPSDFKNAEAEKLYFLGRAKKRERDYLGAVRDLLAAEQRWSELGNNRRRVDALSEAALSLYSAGRLAESLKIRQKALSLCQSLGDHQKESALLVAIGRAQADLGQLEESGESGQQALEIAQTTGSKFVEADAYSLLANIAEQKGDKFAALDLYEKTIAVWRQLSGSEVDQVRTLELLGRANSSLGNSRDAMKNFESAELIARQIGSQELRGECLSRLSEGLRNMGKPESALTYGLKALTLWKNTNNPVSMASTLNAVALIYRDLKRLDEARIAEEDALAIFRQRSAPRDEATAHYNLGLVLLDTKNTREAIEHFHRAVDIATGLKFKEGEIAGRYGLALGYQANDNVTAARQQVEISLERIEEESKVAASSGAGSAMMESRFGSFQLLIDLLSQAPAISEQDKQEALEASEHARWGVLLDRFSHATRAGMQATSLASEIKKEKSLLASSDSERKKAEASGKPTKKLQDLQDQIESRIKILEARMRSRTDASKLTPISLQTIQDNLGSDAILLEYFVGKTRSYLWRVTSTSNEMFTLASREELERVCTSFYSLLSRSGPLDDGKFGPLREKVSRLLLEPVAGRLNARRIVIVADGPLNYVPFGLLRDPGTPVVQGLGDSIISTHDVVYEPSMSVLQAIRQETAQRQSPPGLLAVIANPKFSLGGYPPLPYSGDEEKALMALVPEGKGFAAVGCKATRRLLMSDVVTKFKYLHLATHGENHPGLPALSGVALSPSDCEGRQLDDGILRLQDIYALNLPLDMVVLSACRTALGKQLEGEGFEGLPEGLIAAGSARVVASLWNVDDRSVTLLMQRFYKGLIQEKLPAIQALREAQLSMARSTRWKSPYYWAGFKLHGEWR